MRRTSQLLNNLKNFREIKKERRELVQETGFKDPLTQKLVAMLAVLGIIFLNFVR